MATIKGTARRDVLKGGGFGDTILGLAGDDDLFGGGGDDTLKGGAGGDKLSGGAGNDLLFGNDGNDRIVGGAGDDKQFGSAGDDTLNGGTGNDTLVSGTGTNILNGGEGNDRLVSGDSNDIMIGGAGNDRLVGGGGGDTYFGGDGDDVFVVGGEPLQVGDIVDGGAGIDTVDYSTALSAVVADLFSNTTFNGALFDTFSGVESIIGSQFGDQISPGGDGGTAFGGLGNDRLQGTQSGHTVFLVGGGGDDNISGGSASQDFIKLERGQGLDSIAILRSDGDRFMISKVDFAVGAGVTVNEVKSGVGAQTADIASAQFLYNQTTKELAFDPDGTGAAAAEAIAIVTFVASGAALLSTDFFVV